MIVQFLWERVHEMSRYRFFSVWHVASPHKILEALGILSDRFAGQHVQLGYAKSGLLDTIGIAKLVYDRRLGLLPRGCWVKIALAPHVVRVVQAHR